MIDPATGWFEIAKISGKVSITTAVQVDKCWFCWYPQPTKVIYNIGLEFIGPSIQEIIKDVYKVQAKPMTVKNAQANSVLEGIHQVLAKILQKFEQKEQEVDKDDP